MVGFLQFLSLFAASLPPLGFAWLVWSVDRYDREPIWMVCCAFAWGAFLATSASLLGNTIFAWLLYHLVGPAQADLLVAPFVAPLVEEPSKALILFGLLASRRFDGGPDGFVYGAATGFGFAATENLLYFWGAAESANAGAGNGFLIWSGTVFARTFFSTFLHAAASGMFGASLGLGKFRWLPTRIAIGLVGLACALGAHASWNGLLTLGQSVEDWGTALVVLDFLLLPAGILVLALIFGLLLSRERGVIERELLEEAKAGHLPLEYAKHIATLRGRLLQRVAPVGIPEKTYVRAATDLALRKAQATQANGSQKQFLLAEVTRLRGELLALGQPFKVRARTQ